MRVYCFAAQRRRRSGPERVSWPLRAGVALPAGDDPLCATQDCANNTSPIIMGVLRGVLLVHRQHERQKGHLEHHQRHAHRELAHARVRRAERGDRVQVVVQLHVVAGSLPAQRCAMDNKRCSWTPLRCSCCNNGGGDGNDGGSAFAHASAACGARRAARGARWSAGDGIDDERRRWRAACRS